MELYELLKKYHLLVTTAESCTGGLVASNLVDIAGISEFYKEGYITYAESSKEHLLGVLASTIDTRGVVSEETAGEMAVGAAKKAGADVSITTTGIAGPGGGTKELPVGTVCFGCVAGSECYTATMHFCGTRSEIRHAAAEYALSFLECCIKKTYGGDACES